MINSNSIKLKLEERQKQNVCRAYLRRAVYFVLWWIKTLYFASVAPFIILAFFFWIAWFSDSVTMATVHNVLTQVVTGATPDEWAKGSLAALNLLTLPIAVVIFWRLIASTLCNRTGVAISMPGGKTISGPALVTRDGDHWIVNFNGSVKPKS